MSRLILNWVMLLFLKELKDTEKIRYPNVCCIMTRPT
jgi:hypothetical protein